MYKLVLCWRYLLTRYLALVCIVSVMLGVATLIVVNSVMTGFSTKLKDRLHGLLSDIDVEATTFHGIDHPDEKIERIRRDPFLAERIEAMTPMMEVFAMLQFEINGETILKPVRLIGVDAQGRARLGGFAEYIENKDHRDPPSFQLREEALKVWERNQERERLLEREPFAPPPKDGLPPPAPPVPSDFKPKGIMIGHAIAHARIPVLDEHGKPVLKDGKPVTEERELIHPGDEVVLTTISGQRIEPVSFRGAVVDYIKTEMSEYDANYVYIALEDLQHLRTMHSRATSIQIKLKDYERDKGEVSKRLTEMFPSCVVSTWEQKQGPLLAAISIEKGILNLLLFMIIGVAGFGILAIFSMIVVEKTRDIGVLKALGASNGGVMKIFLGYGLLLGLVGALLGTGLGVAFTVYINQIEKKLTDWTGQEIFDRSVYYFKDIPTDIQASNVLLIVLGAVSIAVVFSIMPALRAAMLHPVRALRYE
ncbi:MAG TPA: FtsX-like permease family protein [Gemmataceae bacterium]|nr:FtsX-like permease family protein [Gemmataceae bacterium]